MPSQAEIKKDIDLVLQCGACALAWAPEAAAVVKTAQALFDLGWRLFCPACDTQVTQIRTAQAAGDAAAIASAITSFRARLDRGPVYDDVMPPSE